MKTNEINVISKDLSKIFNEWKWISEAFNIFHYFSSVVNNFRRWQVEASLFHLKINGLK